MDESSLRLVFNTQDEDEQDEIDAFEWSGRWQHILFFISYVMDFDAALSILEKDKGKSFTSLSQHSECVQLIILTVFIGGPFLLFQTSVGQYTRRSCLFLGEMFPLAYGLGYSMLLMSFFGYVSQVFYTSKLFYCISVTLFNRKQPWMMCYANYYQKFPGCISQRDIDACAGIVELDRPCFSLQNTTLSAYIFKQAFIFGRIEVDDKDSKFRTVRPQNLMVLFFCIFNAFIVFISLKTASNKTTKTFYTALRTGMILCVVLLVSILVVVFTQSGTLTGFEYVISNSFHPKLLTTDAWSEALGKMIRTMRLAEGGHIVLGSFMPLSKPDIWRAAILSAAYVLLILAATVYYHLFLGQLIYKLKMHVGKLVEGNEENTIFVLFPTSLGTLPSSYFFCLIYFVVLYLLSFFSLAVKMIVMEKSITKHFGLSSYYMYVRYTICGLASLLSLAYESSVSVVKAFPLSLMQQVISEALFSTEDLSDTYSVIFVTLQLIILNIYGTARFSDDIEYLMRTKVKKFIRMIWSFSLIFLIFGCYVYISKVEFKTYTATKISFVTFLSAPLVIVLVFKIFTFAKEKNLVGLLRATESYGPPALNERILRVLYNPRHAVRYKRPKEFCDHKCLNSAAMNIAIKEELDQISRFMEELKLEAGNIAMESMIMD